MNPNFRLGLCLTGAALALIAFGAGHLGISLVFVFMTLMLVIDAAIEIICTAAVNNAFDSAEIEENNRANSDHRNWRIIEQFRCKQCNVVHGNLDDAAECCDRVYPVEMYDCSVCWKRHDEEHEAEACCAPELSFSCVSCAGEFVTRDHRCVQLELPL